MRVFLGLLWLYGHSALAGTWDAPLVPGTVLMATERVADARFQQTVIVVAQHDEARSVGFILNRPTDPYGRRLGGYVDPERHFSLTIPLETEWSSAPVVLRFNGYCGWSPGQLAREIDAGAWRVLQVDLAWAAHQPSAALWGTLRGWWSWAWL